MAKSTKRIEEKVEDFAKKKLDANHVRYFTKTESVNTEIDEALTKAESKSGGKGGNYPDIAAFDPYLVMALSWIGILIAYIAIQVLDNFIKTIKIIYIIIF